MDIKAIQPSDLVRLPRTHEAVIPESYLDAMGHMNVMWYTHLFSLGSMGLFPLIGLTIEHFVVNQAGTFALEAHTRYLAEVRAGQRVCIRSRIVARSAKRFHHVQFLVNEDDDRIAAVAEHVGAYIDMRIRRMAAMPPEVTKPMDQLIDAHMRLGWDPPLCGTMAP